MKFQSQIAAGSIESMLLLCLQNTPSGVLQSNLEQIPFDMWEQVFGLAKKMTIESTLARSILDLNIEIPGNIRTEMQTALQNNTARNMNIIAGLQPIANALKAKSIPLILLKGIHLAADIYTNIGERLMSDIDILVPQESIKQTLEQIESIGYRPVRPYDLEQETHLHRHIPPYKKKGMPLLEIHWHILKNIPEDKNIIKSIWEHAESIKVGDIQTLGLCPQDLLLHLCAHASFGQYQNALRYLVDIKLVLEKFEHELNWLVIVEQARLWDVSNSLYLSLRITDELLGCDLSQQVWELFDVNEFNDQILSAACARIFNAQVGHPIFTSAQASGNISQMVKRVWNKIALPPKHLASLYGLQPESRLVYFYYPLRIKDMLFLHGPQLISIFFGRKRERSVLSADGLLAEYLGWLGDSE